MLDTRFPRPLGDVGHPDSFGVPVRHHVVRGAVPRRVVASAEALRASELGAQFVDAARLLAAQGARAVTTSCGFLVLLQRELQAAVKVPMVSSSLLALPSLLEGEQRVGVLTISAEHLGWDHLLAAGVAPDRLGDVVVQGMNAEGAFAAPILSNEPVMNQNAAAADVLRTALALQARAPDLRAVVLECTNLPPYAEAVRAATGWRTHTLLDVAALTDWSRGSCTATSARPSHSPAAR